ILLSWAAGGTPRADEKLFIFGNLEGVQSPTYPGPQAQWQNDSPDLKIPMDAAYTVPAGTIEQDDEFTLATGLKEDAWVRAVDFLPGDRSMVRDALISVENGPLLAAWVPGDQAIAAPNGTAFKVPAGSKLKVKIHYKKNWNDEANAKSDRSTVGLYLTEAPLSGRSLEAMSIGWNDANANLRQERRFTGSVKTGARVVAL